MQWRLFFRWIFCFALINILLAQGIGLFYFIRSSQFPESVWAWLFAFFYWNGQFALLSALFLLLIFPVLLLLSPFKLHRLLLPLLASVIFIFLFVDTHVYGQYKYHINKFVLDLLISGKGQVISFSWQAWLFVVLLILGLFVVEVMIGEYLWRRLQNRRVKPFATAAFGFYLTCIFVFNIIHVFADGMYYRPITRLAGLFPLSYPLFAQDLLMKYNLVDVDEYKKRQSLKVNHNKEDFRYPLEPLKCEGTGVTTNILFIVIDSLRADVLTPDVMPNATQLGLTGQTFTNHNSTSNSTRYGIFSLFYGIPGSYFEAARTTGTPPALLDRVFELGYEIKAFASAPLTKPEFDQTVFVKVPDLRKLSKAPKDYARDIEITQEWISFLKVRKEDKPFFGFLFYDAPHQYAFPPDEKLKFLPSWERVDYMALHPQFDPLPFKNRYKNSVHFVDKLVGEVLTDLKNRGLDKNTVIVLTGDHGQEFNDSGQNYWGHNSNFSKAQTQVPLVIHWPGREPKVFDHSTTHYDVSVTLLQDLFGCTNEPRVYSSGDNLFDSDHRQSWVVMSSYDTFAVDTQDQMVVVGAMGNYEVLDSNYRVIDSASLKTEILWEATGELRRF